MYILENYYIQFIYIMFEICLYINIQIDFIHKGDIYKYILDNNKKILLQMSYIHVFVSIIVNYLFVFIIIHSILFS